MMDELWSYYTDAAISAGKNPTTGESFPFSLEFFFCNTRPQEQNELVRAFLGDETAALRGTEPPSMEEIARHTSRVTPLYEGQTEAIAKALSYPISLVQGPPGTGKTEMILNLISVLLHCRPGASIAVVSTNNEAIRNIVQKLQEGGGEDPVLADICRRFAVLGSKSNIRTWRRERASLREDVSAIDPDTLRIAPAYLERYPVFSSTVHSLRKIFVPDGEFHNQFDYVIADECSQMSVMLGIVAMSCAKNLVLIGDNQQLPPVISPAVKGVSGRYPGLPDLYKEEEGKSFLALCEKLFSGAPKSFLDCHYRCHPSIIEFCNRYVYDNRLTVRTHDDGQFRMRAVWYEGDYCEKISEPEDGGADAPVRRKIYNQRQIEIFLREELPGLAEKLRDPNFSAAVISPFRREIELLSQRLREALAALNLSDSDISEELDEDDVPRLTIHKAQGKGFDAVYLLPVEDYYTRNPWSQRKRLINVAVSRAKREFCIIASSLWLPKSLQQTLTGYVLQNGEENEPEEESMYCRKLLRYIADACPEPRGAFGIHRSGIVSVFDKVPLYRRSLPASGKNSGHFLSAPARCVEDALLKAFGDRYTVLRELPLRDIAETENVPCTDPDLQQYRRNSRVDFALCQGNQIRLLIEVDGAFHRDYLPDRRESDEDKNFWIQELLQAEDIFLRLPTDGTTENEIELIESRLAAAKTVLTVSDEAVSRTETAARAQDAVGQLLLRLENQVDGSLSVVQELFSRPGLDEAAKIRAVEMNYTWAETMSYRSHLRSAFYLCRYAVAYAFEYAMLYDLALRLCLENGNRVFSVFSFGAGSLLDAWSLAYAKARLTIENPACGDIKLYYKGIDRQAWDACFVEPARIYAGEGFTPRTEGGPVEALFEKVWLYNWDINRFLQEDILSRPQRNLYYNTLVFPKIINELSEDDMDQLEEALSQCRLTYDEYYLLVSHSDSQRRKSVEFLNRLVRAMNPEDTYEVTGTYSELLSPESRRAFERAWMGGDRLVSLAGEDALPFRCYEFGSAAGGREGSSQERGAYIDQHNSDFTYSAPRDFLSTLDGRNGLRASQVRTVDNIVFDAVRLKRKEE